MTNLLRTSALVAALAVALPMLAQRGVSPSITSGTYLGYPAASILTPNNQRLGDSAPRIHNTGPFGTGAFAGHPVMHGNKGFIPQHNHRNRFGGIRFGYSIPYYPAYYYDPFAYGYGGGVVVEDNSSLPGAGTFNTNQQQYAPRAGNNSVIDEQGGRFYERTITERSSEPLPDPSAKTQPAPAAQPASANANEDNDVRTLLIFKDGRRLEVVNYAIMGTTVYVFAGDRRKIPLTELDLDATVKANEDRGTDFHVPPSPDPS